MEHCEAMRERFHTRTHTYICTRRHTHTKLLWLFRPVQRKATMGVPPPLVGPHRAQSDCVCFVHIKDKAQSWSKCLAPGIVRWMDPRHWRHYNGISPGEPHNSIRNTNGISWLSLSWAQLFQQLSQAMILTIHCLRLCRSTPTSFPRIWIPTNRKHLDILW